MTIDRICTIGPASNNEETLSHLIKNGTNAVMLSAESASGGHPVESIKTLRLVSEFAEHVKKDGPFVMKDVLALLHKSI